MPTRLFLCHTHFFKNVVRKADQILKDKKMKNGLIKSLFLFCFTLLQNSETLQDFTHNLELCYKIFCSNHGCINYIEAVNNLVNKRNLNILCDIHDPSILKLETEKDKENNDYYGIYLDRSTYPSIVDASYYTKYFKEQISKYSG